MAKRIKIASTCRRCGALPENAGAGEVDLAVATYLNQALCVIEPQKPDFIVLPEMCDMPCNWDLKTYVRYISERTACIYDFVQRRAQEMNAWIAFSTLREISDGVFRNSCILFDRAGRAAIIYDKQNPTLGELEAGIMPGEETRVLDCELGRVGAAICFDLNYTDLALEYKRKKVDLLLFPSLFQGGLLRQLWAYTARAWLIGACGGGSVSIVSPAGEVTAQTRGYFSELVSAVNLDCALIHLDFQQEKLTELIRRYGDTVKLHDPGGQGTVLLENENDDICVEDILKEFALETLDGYLERVRREASAGRENGRKYVHSGQTGV